jgi:hypothetical protein
LDAFAERDGSTPILVEVFAHVGPCKTGQHRKLSRDMTKLLLAERRLARPCRKIIAVIDEQAIAHTTRGWDGEFARDFGIELRTVTVPESLRAEIAGAQVRQRNPHSTI